MFNHELQKPKNDNVFWSIFWFLGKCGVTIASAITLQQVIQHQMGVKFPADDFVLGAILVVIAIKMWSR